MTKWQQSKEMRDMQIPRGTAFQTEEQPIQRFWSGCKLDMIEEQQRGCWRERREESNRKYGWTAMEKQIEQNFGRRLAFMLREMKPSGGVRIWSGLKLDWNRDTLADTWVLDFKVARVEARVKEENCTSYLPTAVLGYVLPYYFIHSPPLWVFKVS